MLLHVQCEIFHSMTTLPPPAWDRRGSKTMTNQWNPDSFHWTPGAQSLHYDITTFEGDQMATIDPSIVNGNPDIAKFLGLASKCQQPGSLFTFLTITVAMDSLRIVPSINSSIAPQSPTHCSHHSANHQPLYFPELWMFKHSWMKRSFVNW